MAESLVYGLILRSSAPTEALLPIVTSSLTKTGYALRSGAGELPIKLRWGSLAFQVAAQATADFLPLMLVPSLARKWNYATLAITVQSAEESDTQLRFALRGYLPRPTFQAHVADVLAALQQAGYAAAAGEITDLPPDA